MADREAPALGGGLRHGRAALLAVLGCPAGSLGSCVLSQATGFRFRPAAGSGGGFNTHKGAVEAIEVIGHLIAIERRWLHFERPGPGVDYLTRTSPADPLESGCRTNRADSLRRRGPGRRRQSRRRPGGQGPPNLIATDAVVLAVNRPTEWPTNRGDPSVLPAVVRAAKRCFVLKRTRQPTGLRAEHAGNAGRAAVRQSRVGRCPTAPT